MFVSVGPHFFYNPRIYTWRVDALDFPGSLQTLMRSILGSSPKYAYVEVRFWDVLPDGREVFIVGEDGGVSYVFHGKILR
jgi:hypothetical protein